ncbi:MAG: acyltransferase [Muribaculaceae bacterium]|nr:acyltransferase [Muribaculaceae bacterium]
MTKVLDHTDFADIAPYEDSEFAARMRSLVEEPGFEHAVRFVMPEVDYQEFVNRLKQVPNNERFQLDIMWPFLEMLAKRTTTGVSMSGQESINPDHCYTFITNHRDIVLDASFLNLMFIRHQLPTSEVAIGNNLLIYDWITDLVKLNKSFIVKRNLKMTAALQAAKQLSGYIHYAIQSKHQSVWIAQREGRAKDSNDVTQESLIKMLALAGGESMLDNLKAINLCPVAITYEYDPNDYLKAREMLLRHRDPEFKKSQRDDLFSMETGLLQFKGRVHFTVSRCINDELNKLEPGLEKAEVAHQVAAIIDRNIHAGYMIYPVNYIAYDRYYETDRFRDCYTEQDILDFDAYIDGQLAKVDVEDPTTEDVAFMRGKIYEMYANPLKNKLAATQG